MVLIYDIKLRDGKQSLMSLPYALDIHVNTMIKSKRVCNAFTPEILPLVKQIVTCRKKVMNANELKDLYLCS